MLTRTLFKRTPIAFWLSLLFVLLITLGAFARQPQGMEPPPRFVHPFDGIVVVLRIDPELVPGICVREFERYGATPENTRGILGCTIQGGVDGVCKMVIINRPVVWWGGTIQPDDIYRHELAHCNGWPQNHEGGM